MLRIASSRRSVLVSGLASVLALSAAHAQTRSPQTTVAVDAQQSNKIEGAWTVSGAAPTLGFAPMFHSFTSSGGPSSSELPPVVNAPFSATVKREDVTRLVDGNRIVRTSMNRLARDSQGRTRIERPFPPMPGATPSAMPPSIVQISDPLTGEGFMLNIQMKTANVMPANEPSPVLQAPIAAPPMLPQMGSVMLGFVMSGMISNATPAKETSLGEKMIDGIRTVGRRANYIVAANVIGNEKPITMTLEQWFSPDLGMVMLSTQRSSAGIENTYKLEQLDRSEPDRSLFTVPADFTKADVTRQLRNFRLEPTQEIPPASK